MKHLWTAAFILVGAGALLAQQQPTQEDLVKKRDAKLAEAWVKDGGWITDFAKAREEAKGSGKPIFAYFTVTYFH